MTPKEANIVVEKVDQLIRANDGGKVHLHSRNGSLIHFFESFSGFWIGYVVIEGRKYSEKKELIYTEPITSNMDAEHIERLLLSDYCRYMAWKNGDPVEMGEK